MIFYEKKPLRVANAPETPPQNAGGALSNFVLFRLQRKFAQQDAYSRKCHSHHDIVSDEKLLLLYSSCLLIKCIKENE
jgi:hypothetical protein